jgi:uncharacterized DUF497 family protein
MPHGYSYDPEKDRKNKEKGRPSIEEVFTVFEDENLIRTPRAHKGKPQLRITGRSESGRHITVVLEWDGIERRICTWWPASRQERRNYEMAKDVENDEG